MVSFNVLHEPWIPAEDSQGKVSEFGILEVLRKAPDLQAVTDPSPLFQYGIYRLLIAFLSDALRPMTKDDLLDLYDSGSFPMEKLEQYVKECEKEEPRFDLFDAKYPFLQSAFDPKYDEGKERSVSLLVHDLPSGNNPVHFNHSYQDEQVFCPQVCVKALSAVSVFCTAGTQGPSGINGAPPWFVLVKRNNIFETLVFNMWIPDGTLSLDNPPIAWRNNDIVVPGKQVSTVSYLYGLTWHSRRVTLIPGEKSGVCSYSGMESPILVASAYFQKGLKFEGHGTWTDPHTPRVQTEKGISAIKPKEGKALWRDVGPLVLLHNTDMGKYRYFKPEVVHQFANMSDEIDENDYGTIEVEAYGLVTSQAKLESWIYDKVAVNRRLADSWNKVLFFLDELNIVESVARKISEGLKTTGLDEKLVSSLSGNAQGRFFQLLRQPFVNGFQMEVAEASETAKDWQIELSRKWRKKLRKLSLQLFVEVLDQLGTGGTMLEKSAKALAAFRSGLFKITKVEEVGKDGTGEHSKGQAK